MPRVSQVNLLPVENKIKLYKKLIPPSIFKRFNIDPVTFCTPDGRRVVEITAPEKSMETIVEVKLHPSDIDPIYYIEVSDSKDFVQLQWDFIKVIDPTAPRFATNVDPSGKSRWLNWTCRNIPEEIKALQAGLAPGQIRRGLRLAREIDECLDDFCRACGLKSIYLEALYYHTAIMFERHGYRYFKGFKMMQRINELFQPGKALYNKLDGSTPFRQPGFDKTVRGRSWAIHDGVLDEIEDDIIEFWDPPKMYRMVGQHYDVCTFPNAVY